MDQHPVSIFLSYSHKDEALRDELHTHLATLQRQQLAIAWHDRMIVPGQDGDKEIDSQLNKSEIVLLLVSSDFVRSLYCWEKELMRALERHERGDGIVIPIIVRPVDLEGVPFERIQSLPTDRKAVTSWQNRDEAWTDVIRGVRRAIKELMQRRERRRNSSEAKPMSSILATAADELHLVGIPSGYADLDRAISRLHRSQLVVVAGRPMAGRTSFVTNIAVNAAMSGHTPVGMFTTEMSREQLAFRMISSLSFVPITTIRNGSYSDDEWPRILSAINLIRSAPLYVEDSPEITLESLESQIQRIKQRAGVQLVIIDQMEGIRNDDNSRVLNASRELKRLASSLNVIILATSQLPRKVEQRNDKRPHLGDIENSSADDADVVLLLYREEVYEPNTERKGIVDVEIAKQRSGPNSEVQLMFLAKYLKFQDMMKTDQRPTFLSPETD